MNLLENVYIPSCLGMGHCMGDVTVKAFEIGLHQSLDRRWEMVHVLDCMFEGVVFGIR